MFSKIHPGEAHVEEALVQFPEKGSHLLVVICNVSASVVMWFFNSLKQEGRKEAGKQAGREGEREEGRKGRKEGKKT